MGQDEQEDGYLTVSNAPHAMIGRRTRRYIESESRHVYGWIVAFLPLNVIPGVGYDFNYWLNRHDDGEEEELDAKEVKYAIELCEYTISVQRRGLAGASK